MSSPFSPQPGLTATSLRIVRYAMLVLLLGFGAFAYYQSQHVVPDPETPTNLSMIKWVGYGLCAAAVVGIAVLRQARERSEVPARLTLGLVGSAFAEGAAL